MLCAHLDTVPPSGPIEPVVARTAIVRNAADTILGADNKSAVVVMLEAARRVVDERRPHGGIELLFTPKEEVGLLGAYAFDASRLEARARLRLRPGGADRRDHPRCAVGSVRSMSASTAGRRTRGHGARGGTLGDRRCGTRVADLRLGRVDERDDRERRVDHGGTARNIVPEWCTSTAEARSHDETQLADLVQEMIDAFAFAASTVGLHGRDGGARAVPRLPLPARRPARAPRGRCPRARGFEATTDSPAAAPTRTCSTRGLPCLNLANGMADIHTPDERIAVSDLDSMVDVTLALVDEARCRSALGAGPSPRSWSGRRARPARGGRDRLCRVPAADGPGRGRRRRVVNVQARARARLRRVRRALREPHARPRASRRSPART